MSDRGTYPSLMALDRQALISALQNMLKTKDFSSTTLSGSNFKILSRFANRCPLIMKDSFHASVRALLNLNRVGGPLVRYAGLYLIGGGSDIIRYRWFGEVVLTVR